MLQGQYPSIYKFEVSTPVHKKYPVEKMNKMRNISGLLTADNLFEKLISEHIVSDMKKKQLIKLSLEMRRRHQFNNIWSKLSTEFKQLLIRIPQGGHLQL